MSSLANGDHICMVITLKIGTDCSGADAPLFAAQALRACQRGELKISHEWSCDHNIHAQQFIMLNHKPKRMYGCIHKRKHEQLPAVHLYCCGFPCQPFSSLGLKQGWQDARMSVYESMLKTIGAISVQCILLENVPRLASHNRGKA